jgi:Flp pilus assembly protein TadB
VTSPWTNFGAAGSRRVATFLGPGVSWPLRLALAFAALVLTAVVLILVVPAGIVALLVFAVASAILSIRDRAYRVVGRDRDGRRNVRVIDDQSR